MSLTEIKQLANKRRAGRKDPVLQAMIMRRDKLNMRAEEIAALQRVVQAKIKWLSAGMLTPAPELPVALRTRAASKEDDANY